MPERFTKLLASITDSSVWAYDNETRIVWITLLAMADDDGVIHASVSGIARRAIIPLEKTAAALETFMGPDPDSRHVDDEAGTGARLVKVDGGYLLSGYSRIRSSNQDELEHKREVERQRKRRLRSRGCPDVSRDVTGQSRDVPNVTGPSPLLFSSSQENTITLQEEESHEEGEWSVEGGEHCDRVASCESVVAAWNETCGDTLPKVQVLSEPRKAAIRQRLKDADGFEALKVVFARVAASDFLSGRSEGRGGQPFRATFDWVMAPRNFVKIVEGNYDNRTGGGPGGKKAYRPRSSHDRCDLDTYGQNVEDA